MYVWKCAFLYVFVYVYVCVSVHKCLANTGQQGVDYQGTMISPKQSQFLGRWLFFVFLAPRTRHCQRLSASLLLFLHKHAQTYFLTVITVIAETSVPTILFSLEEKITRTSLTSSSSSSSSSSPTPSAHFLWNSRLLTGPWFWPFVKTPI